MDTHEFELGATAIFAISQGAGVPLVCMHGITANAYVFEPMMQMLSADFQVTSIDQRGHGRSGRPATYSAGDFASDVAGVIEKMGRGPAVLLGHALGARNAFFAANLFPERVRGLVAVDFSPFIEGSVIDALEARVKTGDRVFADIAEIESYLAQRYPKLPQDAIARRARHGYRPCPGGYEPLANAGAMALTVQGMREDFKQEVKQLGQPCIMVHGSGRKMLGDDAWAATRALRPDIEAVSIEGADHYIPETHPAELSAVVRRMLQKIG